MEERKVKLSNEKEYVVKEVLYKDIASMQTGDNKADVAKALLKLSANISDEEWETLSMRDGVKLQKVVNDVNGLTEDFLSTAPSKENISTI